MQASERPVYQVDLTEKDVVRLKRRVRAAMGLSEAEMMALIPNKTGFRFVGCPDCDAGAQEGQLRWSIRDPHRVECRYCEMVFPNEAYPDDQVLTVVNPVGETVTYPFWEDETGFRYYFRAKAWREARVYFATIAEDLGQLYQATGDATYARRATLILDAFARYYPGFLVSYDRAHNNKRNLCLNRPIQILGESGGGGVQMKCRPIWRWLTMRFMQVANWSDCPMRLGEM